MSCLHVWNNCYSLNLSTFYFHSKKLESLSDCLSEHIQDILNSTNSVYPSTVRESHHTEGTLTAYKITQWKDTKALLAISHLGSKFYWFLEEENNLLQPTWWISNREHFHAATTISIRQQKQAPRGPAQRTYPPGHQGLKVLSAWSSTGPKEQRLLSPAQSTSTTSFIWASNTAPAVLNLGKQYFRPAVDPSHLKKFPNLVISPHTEDAAQLKHNPLHFKDLPFRVTSWGGIRRRKNSKWWQLSLYLTKGQGKVKMAQTVWTGNICWQLWMANRSARNVYGAPKCPDTEGCVGANKKKLKKKKLHANQNATQRAQSLTEEAELKWWNFEDGLTYCKKKDEVDG